jgi:hypothetical protein
MAKGLIIAVAGCVAVSLLFGLLGCRRRAGTARSSREMNHIDKQLEDARCEVYFFASFSGYSHPIRPANPMPFEEAIRKSHYARAWMCGPPDERLFVMFEVIEQTRRPYEGHLPPIESGDAGYFGAQDAGEGKIEAGAALTPAETFDANDYVELTRTDGGTVTASSVQARVQLRYRYRYAKGVLSEVETTNNDGVVKIVPL